MGLVEIRDLEYKDTECIAEHLDNAFKWTIRGKVYVGLINNEYHCLLM